MLDGSEVVINRMVISGIGKLALFHSSIVLRETWGLAMAKHLHLLAIYIENRTQKPT